MRRTTSRSGLPEWARRCCAVGPDGCARERAEVFDFQRLCAARERRTKVVPRMLRSPLKHLLRGRFLLRYKTKRIGKETRQRERTYHSNPKSDQDLRHRGPGRHRAGGHQSGPGSFKNLTQPPLSRPSKTLVDVSLDQKTLNNK